jgi:sulfur-carrier protein adenylyltransferase/sulfurtransferase
VGGRSRVAAQLLSGQGFREVYNLKGGIKAWQGVKAFGPVELNLDLIRGDESPLEIISLAYGMEEALRRFYSHFGQRQPEGRLKDLFRLLAAAEEKHQELLKKAYQGLAPSPGDAPTLPSAASSPVLEGGFQFEEFVRENDPRLNTETDILELSLMLETQALDLYLRFAGKMEDQETKKVLFRLGDEEKAHLAALGRLLDETSLRK